MILHLLVYLRWGPEVVAMLPLLATLDEKQNLYSLKYLIKTNLRLFPHGVGMKQNIKKILLSKNIYEILPVFRFGFELETQATGGKTFQQYHENGSFNEETFNAHIATKVAVVCRKVAGYNTIFTVDPEFIPVMKRVLVTSDLVPASRVSRLRAPGVRRLIQENYQQYKAALGHGISINALLEAGKLTPEVVTALKLKLTEQFKRTEDRSRFIERIDATVGLQRSWPEFNSELLEIGRDGSVRGFEVRTKGGLKIKEVLKAIDNVFTKEHEIDTKCSFHIHLSVAGVVPKYSRSFQWRMIEYLINHMNDLPKAVRDRWQDVEARNYFRALTSQDKYSFVHRHGNHNTWEFRCFGNIKNVEDARKCLLLAARAYQYAIQSAYRKQRSKIVGEEMDYDRAQRRAVDHALNNGKPLYIAAYLYKKDLNDRIPA